MKKSNLENLINNLNVYVAEETQKRQELREINAHISKSVSEITDTFQNHDILERIMTALDKMSEGVTQDNVPGLVAEVNYLASVVTSVGGIVDGVSDDETLVEGTSLRLVVEPHIVGGVSKHLLKVTMSTEYGGKLRGFALSSDILETDKVELCLYYMADNGVELAQQYTMPFNQDIAKLLYDTSVLAMNDVVNVVMEPLEYLYEGGYLKDVTVKGMKFEGDVTYSVDIPTLLDLKKAADDGEDVRPQKTEEVGYGFCAYCGDCEVDCGVCGDDEYEENACPNCGDLVDYFTAGELCEQCLLEVSEQDDSGADVECDCYTCTKEWEDNYLENEANIQNKDHEAEILNQFLVKLLTSKL